MFKAFAVAATLAIVPAAAFAQSPQNPQGAQGGALGGATAGAVGGAIVGGPVGAVVGGVGGAVVGAIIGDNTPRFRTYVVEQRHPSYTYAQPVAVGTTLPREGITYYEVPAQFGQTSHRYTVVNDRTVLVDPATGRVVQILE